MGVWERELGGCGVMANLKMTTCISIEKKVQKFERSTCSNSKIIHAFNMAIN
jgi:hypothetical protein